MNIGRFITKNLISQVRFCATQYVINLVNVIKNEGKAKFMKVNYGNLLSKLAGFAGLAGVSLLISLPVGAQGQGTTGTLNPSPSIFNEPPYNRGRRVQPGEVTPNQPNGNSVTPGQPMSPDPTVMPSQPVSGDQQIHLSLGAIVIGAVVVQILLLHLNQWVPEVQPRRSHLVLRENLQIPPRHLPLTQRLHQLALLRLHQAVVRI